MSTVNELSNVYATSWELTESVAINAPAERVYGMFSDITRMGEWSPECVGGRWVSGAPGHVGSRFLGFNKEGAASWTSESEVIEATPARGFGFTVLRFCAGEASESSEWIGGSQPGDMTWSFTIEANGAGCVLTQKHTMRLVGPFYRQILEGVEESERPSHVQRRKEHLQHSMHTTLQRLKALAEQQD